MGAANLLEGLAERSPSVAGAPGAVNLGSGLRLEALLPAGATKASAVTIMIRPEDVAFTRDSP